MEENKKRIALLDIVRGAAILAMVVYHALFSLIYIFGWDLPLFHSPVLSEWAVPMVGGTFIFISGICTRFSKSSRRRGLRIFGFGLLMTAATALFVPEFIIRFGILHFMGIAMVLFSFLRPGLDRLPEGVAVLVLSLLFVVTFHLPDGFLGIPGLFGAELPPVSVPWLYPFGLLSAGFYSSDYYPLIPWLFLFLLGSILGKHLKAGQGPKWVYRCRLPWLEAVGKHSLWIYVLHQPVIVAFLWLWFQVF